MEENNYNYYKDQFPEVKSEEWYDNNGLLPLIRYQIFWKQDIEKITDDSNNSWGGERIESKETVLKELIQDLETTCEILLQNPNIKNVEYLRGQYSIIRYLNSFRFF